MTASTIPDDYQGFVTAIKNESASLVSDQKQRVWNIGQLASQFMEKSKTHKEKYGNKTMETLAEDTGIKAVQLYEYAKVYDAYASDRAMKRVMGRSKVSASHMIYIARLETDTARDQMERRVENEQLDKVACRHEVMKALGRKPGEGAKSAKGSKGPTPKQVGKAVQSGTKSSLAKSVEKQEPAEVWEMANEVAGSFSGDVLNACAQMHAMIKKLDPGELPAKIKTAAKAHTKAMKEARARLDKYIEKVDGYWS